MINQTTNKYWAVGCHLDYDILYLEQNDRPDSIIWPCIDGPHNSLYTARNKIKSWIRSDRKKLAIELDKINAIRADYVRS